MVAMINAKCAHGEGGGGHRSIESDYHNAP